jgi:hypothetical protein
VLCPLTACTSPAYIPKWNPSTISFLQLKFPIFCKSCWGLFLNGRWWSCNIHIRPTNLQSCQDCTWWIRATNWFI